MKHKHHIVPKHAGGSDEPSNFVELTVEEHAEAHRLLWEENGCWQDFVAWKALSGQIGKEEIQAIKSSEGGKKSSGFSGKTHSEETRKSISETLSVLPNNFFGKKHSEESRKKISEGKKGFIPPNRKKVKIGDKMFSSIKEASEKTGISKYKIRKLLGGE